jgi:tRNA threonylcarbamoyladenosine biosynthesis protein TsaB
MVGEMTWRSQRQHSVQLLPSVQTLLERVAVDKHDLRAIFVCTGPGGYAGLRVGVAAAKGLAFGLSIPIVGVGRLEVEAYRFADSGRLVCAAHRAGRGEVAWAVYAGPRDEWREVSPPRMSQTDDFLSQAPADAILCADEGDGVVSLLTEQGRTVLTLYRRAERLAELGWRRLAAGRVDDARTLAPLYLREPAIGPQNVVS